MITVGAEAKSNNCMTNNLDPKELITLRTGGLYEGAARLVVYLYTFELGIALALFGLYKSPVPQWTMLWTRAGIVMVIGSAVLLVSGLLMVRESVRFSGSTRRTWLLAILTNLITVSLTIVFLEGIFRVTAQEGVKGLIVMHVEVPYGERELFDRARRVLGAPGDPDFWRHTFFVNDAELGWTVGKSRTGPDGMYSSSDEGLRSQVPGIRLRDATPRARVALIGDSFAFSSDVPYQESWGYHLQDLVGPNTQVLNFGVDGYGVDQMYLKYRRDVRPWHPDVVLVGFIQHDLWRTIHVYPFLSLGWSALMVKPRFDDRLPVPELLNVPLPTFEEILSVRSARELPYLDYDPWSVRNRWTSWIDEGPLFLRFVNTLIPHWNTQDPRFSEDAVVALNARLFVRMRDAMVQDGVTPIFVLLPSRDSTGELTRRTFQLAQIPLSDMSACVAEVPETRRTVPGSSHFTGLANKAVAKCTAAEVLRALSTKLASSQ